MRFSNIEGFVCPNCAFSHRIVWVIFVLHRRSNPADGSWIDCPHEQLLVHSLVFIKSLRDQLFHHSIHDIVPPLSVFLNNINKILVFVMINDGVPVLPSNEIGIALVSCFKGVLALHVKGNEVVSKAELLKL